MMNRILHIIPEQVFAYIDQGSYKDVIGRVRFFENGQHDYRQLVISDDLPAHLDGMLETFTPTHILVEYTHFHRLLNHIRAVLPQAFVAVRAINIEPLQHFDNHGFFSRQGPAKLFYGMLGLFRSDISCRRHADVIYPISAWEKDMYWRWLPGRSQVRWLPYFTPEFQIHDDNGAEKQDIIACLPGTTGDLFRRSRDMVCNFIAFAQLAREIAPNYKFIISGDLSKSGLAIPEYISLPGLIADLPGFLRRIRAVAMLSPLGYGFKTTIADALANRSYPLLHPSHYKRSPNVLKDYCIEVKTLNKPLVARILDRINKPFPDLQVNNILRDSSFATLQQDFS